MSDAFAQFEKRRESLERKHRELAKGYVRKINPDGLITVRPKSSDRLQKLPALLTLLLSCLLLKSVMLALVGLQPYEDRIAALAAGSLYERICAAVMQVDPLSHAVSTSLLALFG